MGSTFKGHSPGGHRLTKRLRTTHRALGYFPYLILPVEDYGVFVELAPNLAGLAEIRDGSREKLSSSIGQYAAVYIKSIIPERMKIKLVLIDSYKGTPPPKELKYFIDAKSTTHIDSWRYSPKESTKRIETVF